MSGISIQQILSSRFRTSASADRQTVYLMGELGLSTKANVARLAIGRSLSKGSVSNEIIDAKGLEIPGSSLFTQEDIPVWIGLIATHVRTYDAKKMDSMDDLRLLIRQHWHRGTNLLMEDWKDSGEDFDKFLSTLIHRRAILIDGSSKVPSQVQPISNIGNYEDILLFIVPILSLIFLLLNPPTLPALLCQGLLTVWAGERVWAGEGIEPPLPASAHQDCYPPVRLIASETCIHNKIHTSLYFFFGFTA